MSLKESIKDLDQDGKLKFTQALNHIKDAPTDLSDSLVSVIDQMNEEEYELFLQVLGEISDKGSSDTYYEMKSEDYDEIPVSIEQFISDPHYLGRSTDFGNGIYPYWRDHLGKVFSYDSKITEDVLTGAIGIGKSTIACIEMSYVMYQLLCLKNPAKFYNLMEGSKIAIAIFNISLDQAYGIGYGRLQDMLKRSQWFLNNGTLSGRDAGRAQQYIIRQEPLPEDILETVTYNPGKGVHIKVGSLESHFTGFDVFCLTGDTEIVTNEGVKRLDEIESRVSVVMVDDDGNPHVSEEVEVRQTKVVTELVEIEMEDGTVIRCTPDHKLRLNDGRYVEAQDLTTDDDIMEVHV